MSVTHKFLLRTGRTDVMLPIGAQAVHAGDDGTSQPHLWVLLDPGRETEIRHFWLVATGEDLPVGEFFHISTFTMVGSMATPHGVFVGHVYECWPV